MALRCGEQSVCFAALVHVPCAISDAVCCCSAPGADAGAGAAVRHGQGGDIMVGLCIIKDTECKVGLDGAVGHACITPECWRISACVRIAPDARDPGAQMEMGRWC